MTKIRNIDIRRAEEIIKTANQKFSWYYKAEKTKILFWSENKFPVYILEFIPLNEQNLALMSYITGLLDGSGFLNHSEKETVESTDKMQNKGV